MGNWKVGNWDHDASKEPIKQVSSGIFTSKCYELCCHDNVGSRFLLVVRQECVLDARKDEIHDLKMELIAFAAAWIINARHRDSWK